MENTKFHRRSSKERVEQALLRKERVCVVALKHTDLGLKY